MLGKLQHLVDACIHLQQAAGNTEVGYNAYYDHKLSQINGLANYSGTWADKKFWAHDQNDTEKEILRERLMRSNYPWYRRRVNLVAQQPETLAVMEIQRVSLPGAGTTSASGSFITSTIRLRRRSRRNKPKPTKPQLPLLLLINLVSRWQMAAE